MLKSIHHPIIEGAEVWSHCAESGNIQLTDKLGENAQPETRTLIEGVLEAKKPAILHRDKDFPDTAYDTAATKAAVGIPVIKGASVQSVLTLFFRFRSASAGAVEIWGRDRQRDELGISDAAFSDLGSFTNISHFVRFPRGSGLPGQCWENREAKLVEGLGQSRHFMRAASARSHGLNMAAALPVMVSEHDLQSVVVLLSSQQSPIARAFEIWDVNEDSQTATLRDSKLTDCEAFGTATCGLEFPKGEGIVGDTWASGAPIVSSKLSEADPLRAKAAAMDGLSSGIAMPVYVGEFLRSVFVMFN